MKTDSNRKRHFLTGRYSYHFEGRGEFKEDRLPALVDFLCFEWLGSEIGSEKTLHNVKGRNQQDLTLSFSGKPADDELLWAKGDVLLGPEPSPGGPKKPFEFSLYSPFSEFKGQRDILHTAEIIRSGALPTWFHYRLLGAAVPLQISEFRFGFESFEPVRTISSFGVTPTVTSSIVVEYVKSELFVRVDAERLKDEASLPFESHHKALLQVIEA